MIQVDEWQPPDPHASVPRFDSPLFFFLLLLVQKMEAVAVISIVEKEAKTKGLATHRLNGKVFVYIVYKFVDRSLLIVSKIRLNFGHFS